MSGRRKAVLSPEMIRAIAEMQEEEVFSEFRKFAENITDILLDEHMIDAEDPEVMKERVALVREVRNYATAIEEVFPPISE